MILAPVTTRPPNLLQAQGWMAEKLFIPTGSQKRGQRSARAWRPWFWSAAIWLRNGSVAAAFYLATRSNAVGGLTLVTFVSSLFLREVLEATSRGD